MVAGLFLATGPSLFAQQPDRPPAVQPRPLEGSTPSGFDDLIKPTPPLSGPADPTARPAGPPLGAETLAPPTAEPPGEGPLTEDVTRVLGMTLRKKDSNHPYIDDVFRSSPAWEAGVRKGDYLMKFAGVSDTDYATFIEGVVQVAEETYEGDEIPIVVLRPDGQPAADPETPGDQQEQDPQGQAEPTDPRIAQREANAAQREADRDRVARSTRDEARRPSAPQGSSAPRDSEQAARLQGRRIETTIAAAGRTPEEMQELQDRGQERQKEARIEEMAEKATQRGPIRAAKTEELEELIRLQERALSGELSEAERQRFYDLDTRVYGGGFGGVYGLGLGYGGLGYGVGAANGALGTGAGNLGTNQPTGGRGVVDQSGNVDDSYGLADGTFGGGTASGANNVPGASPSGERGSRLSQLQQEYLRLQAARGGGGLSAAQQRRLNALDRLSGAGGALGGGEGQRLNQAMQRLRSDEFSRLQSAVSRGASLSAQQRARLQQYRGALNAGQMNRGAAGQGGLGRGAGGQNPAAPGTGPGSPSPSGVGGAGGTSGASGGTGAAGGAGAGGTSR
ncbi:hypothetical protein [Botrimarina sp.]|uniref:hypothetical protein n=1 Tax=Botrimarina sp. TaxID=2795802 RepID=UPI0032EAFEC2